MSINFRESFCGGFLAAVLLCAALQTSLVNAVEVEVVEGEPDAIGLGTLDSDDTQRKRRPVSNSATTVYQTQNASTYTADTSTELLLQVQALQDELRLLRGQLEEQNFKLQRLQEQGKQDYIELDKRILALGKEERRSDKPIATSGSKDVLTAEPQVASEIAAATRNSQEAAVSDDSIQRSSETVTETVTVDNKTDNVLRTETRVLSTDTNEGREVYKTAYNMVKERKFDEAKLAMVAFIADYPENKYVPNAYFWLGELYYHDSNFSKSRSQFSTLIDRYPDHRKVPDAKFKLAKVVHQQGDAKQARRLLRSVVTDHSASRVAKSAREYLENNIN